MSKEEVKSNRGVKLNTSSATRRLVIPDIHGCSKTLQALLEQIQLEKSDYLFFLYCIRLIFGLFQKTESSKPREI